MAMIKIQGSTKIQGKTIFDTGFKATDSDAAAYIAAVESADGDVLEDPVKEAYQNFIVGCKSDSIWSSLKAACIMAGARTLNGALVPLVGTAPTNYNFVSGDYDRETGLIGDGSTKYLDSNRNNDDDPTYSKHAYVWASSGMTNTGGAFLGTRRNFSGSGLGQTGMFRAGATTNMRYTFNDWSELIINVNPTIPHRQGLSRSSSNQSVVNRFYSNGTTTTTGTIASTFNGTLGSDSITIYKVSALSLGTCRLSFYSIGEEIDLSLLDSRVSTLMSDLAAAI